MANDESAAAITRIQGVREALGDAPHPDLSMAELVEETGMARRTLMRAVDEAEDVVQSRKVGNIPMYALEEAEG